MTNIENDTTLLVEYLDVCNTAMAAKKASFPHKQVMALSKLLFSGRNFSLLLYDDDPDLPTACYTVRFGGSRIELVAEGKKDPVFSCRVKRDYLRAVAGDRQHYIDHPERLDWDWLRSRLGFSHAEGGEMMTVRELVSGECESVAPGASVRKAATRMRDSNIGALPVLSGGRPVGILTDRDIALRVVAKGKDPARTPVEEIMTTDVICCSEDLTAKDAAGIMEDKGIRRLVVLDANNHPVGLLSLEDLAVQLPSQQLAGETLARIAAKGGYTTEQPAELINS